MALLHLFEEIIPSSHLHILHFNHGVRVEAHRDEVFVEEQAKLLQIPIHLRIHEGLKQWSAVFKQLRENGVVKKPNDSVNY